MDEQRVQQQAADTILERGVRFQIPAPFYLRVIGKKTVDITIYRPKMGTLIAMSGISAELNAELDKLNDGSFQHAYALVEQYGDKILRWIATAIINDRTISEKSCNRLANKLKWRLDANKTATLFMTIVLLGGVKDFTNTIRLFNSINLLERKTETENLSPNEKGS